jgi:FtsH-binding integral membrane protein
MQNQFDPRTATGGYDPAVSVGVPRAARDAGLRSYMLKVYNYMASAVLLTGIVALVFSSTSLVNTVISPETGRPTLLMWVALFGSLGLGLWVQAGINRMSTQTAKMAYFAYAAVLGVALSSIFLTYTSVSIAQTFFAVAAAFAGLSLWGYTTKKDLSGWGTFLMMGVIGVFAGLIVNIGIAMVTGQPSTTLDLAVSAIGVLVFAGLTAYDTQKIKSMYFTVGGTEMAEKSAIYGAVQLYIDFINMFLFLLRFMGDRR